MQTQIKNKQSLSLLTALALAAFNSVTSAFAQGALTPPGAPAPTMKSLDQIEARTPISSVPFTISQNGSYYFTTNLTHTAQSQHAINVGNFDVTIDMNGFTLTMATNIGSIAAIRLGNTPGHHVRIVNGHIIGPGTNFVNSLSGIVTVNTGDVTCENIHLYNLYSGINLEFTSGQNIVRGCSVNTMGNVGIVADVVEDCAVHNTVSIGIQGGSVADCVVDQDSGFIGGGIFSGLVNNCRVTAQGSGISGASSVLNSYASSVSGTAIISTVVQNCVASRPSGTAFQVTVANGCYATAGTNLITYKYNMP